MKAAAAAARNLNFIGISLFSQGSAKRTTRRAYLRGAA
jgi:hypothetical protein